MSDLFRTDKNYSAWLKAIKDKIRSVQLKAAVAVNSELLNFYWELGADIAEKQASAKWGDGFLNKLSHDLTDAFPDMKGFSLRNIKYIRQWFLFYAQNIIGQQAVAQLAQIPWGHNIAIISKSRNIEEALYYVRNTIAHGWSRSVLVHQIESRLYAREGKAVNNFSATLPEPQSDLAAQTLKDPYIFDFLTMTKDCNELELEKGLVTHITNFLLELGAGFAYIGRQVPSPSGNGNFL